MPTPTIGYRSAIRRRRRRKPFGYTPPRLSPGGNIGGSDFSAAGPNGDGTGGSPPPAAPPSCGTMAPSGPGGGYEGALPQSIPPDASYVAPSGGSGPSGPAPRPTVPAVVNLSGYEAPSFLSGDDDEPTLLERLLGDDPDERVEKPDVPRANLQEQIEKMGREAPPRLIERAARQNYRSLWEQAAPLLPGDVDERPSLNLRRTPPRGPAADEVAYTNRLTGNINLSPAVTYDLARGEDRASRVLLHELAHTQQNPRTLGSETRTEGGASAWERFAANRLGIDAEGGTDESGAVRRNLGPEWVREGQFVPDDYTPGLPTVADRGAEQYADTVRNLSTFEEPNGTRRVMSVGGIRTLGTPTLRSVRRAARNNTLGTIGRAPDTSQLAAQRTPAPLNADSLLERIGLMAERRGLNATENPEFGGVDTGAHVDTSNHWNSDALDIIDPRDPTPETPSPRLRRFTNQVVKPRLDQLEEAFYPAAGLPAPEGLPHDDHLHIADIQPGGEQVGLNPPSAREFDGGQGGTSLDMQRFPQAQPQGLTAAQRFEQGPRLTTPQTRGVRQELVGATRAARQAREALGPDLSQLSPEERAVFPFAERAHEQYPDIPISWLYGLMNQESGFQPLAVSSAAAGGLTQFIPSTAEAYNVQYGDSPQAMQSQVTGAAHYLDDLGFAEDPYEALRGYTGGYSDEEYNDPVAAMAEGQYAFLDEPGNQRLPRRVVNRLANANMAADQLNIGLPQRMGGGGGGDGNGTIPVPNYSADQLQDNSGLPTNLVNAQDQGPLARRIKNWITWDDDTLRTFQRPFAQALVSMAQASGEPIDMNEGFRTFERQQYLYDNQGTQGIGVAAVPGTSNHEFGNAIDANLTAEQTALLDQFGLSNTVVGGEPWHVELVGGPNVDQIQEGSPPVGGVAPSPYSAVGSSLMAAGAPAAIVGAAVQQAETPPAIPISPIQNPLAVAPVMPMGYQPVAGIGAPSGEDDSLLDMLTDAYAGGLTRLNNRRRPPRRMPTTF
jgi:hypothetical protein